MGRLCIQPGGYVQALMVKYMNASPSLSALDEIISQIMENSNSSHPVPATEEVMEKLDRSVLEEGCTSTCFTIHWTVTDWFRLQPHS